MKVTQTSTAIPLVLNNEFTYMNFNPDKKEIGGGCLKDQNNMPRCFSQSVRTNKKAWEALIAEWTETTTMYQAISILSKNGVKMHSYCAMD